MKPITPTTGKREARRQAKELRAAVEYTLCKVHEEEQRAIQNLDDWRVSVNCLRGMIGLGRVFQGADAYQG